MKVFYLQANVGMARYVVNYHDGRKQHPDGSAFFDVALFSNKRKRDGFISSLQSAGYTSR